MHCLNCNSEMELIASKEIKYHQCMSCGSAWLGHQAFRLLLDREAPEWHDEAIKARLQLPQKCRWCETLYPPGSHCKGCDRPLEHLCPQDGQSMFIVEEQGIEVDICLACMGIWFDQRELTHLLQMDQPTTTFSPPPKSIVHVHAPVARPQPPQVCQICGYPSPPDEFTFIEGFLRCKECHDDMVLCLSALEDAPNTEPHRHTSLPARPDGPSTKSDELPSIITTVSQLVYGPRHT